MITETKQINLELVEKEDSTDEMFLTGFGFNQSTDIKPNYNFDNESEKN